MMPTVVASVAAILLFCFLAYQETARKRRSFLALRLAASAVACGSLAALSLPASPVPLAGHAIIILTEGYDADSVRLLLTPGKPTRFCYRTAAREPSGHPGIAGRGLAGFCPTGEDGQPVCFREWTTSGCPGGACPATLYFYTCPAEKRVNSCFLEEPVITRGTLAGPGKLRQPG